MLSLRTNDTSHAAANAVNRNSAAASLAATRLSTGYRVNTAQDDAAGLQIATRLKAQTSGMATALRNTQNDISLMQTATGAVDSIVSLFSRMHELAIQAADSSTTQADKQALQGEFGQLFQEVWNTVGTKYNGEQLFANQAKLFSPLQMQTGDTAQSTMTVDLRPQLLGTLNSLKYDNNDLDTILTQNASQAIADTSDAMDSWGAVSSALGAVSNRLQHVFQNLTNMSTNTQHSEGRIMDADYATEAAASTTSQMLTQSGATMLKQSNSVAQFTVSLLDA